MQKTQKNKNLINKKFSDKNILSINKPSIKKDKYKQNIQEKSPVITYEKGKSLKENSNKNHY